MEKEKENEKEGAKGWDRWSTLVLGSQGECAGEGSRIDSAARVELRLCFGAVLCCVASLRMRRISSCPKLSLSLSLSLSLRSLFSLRACVFPLPCTFLCNSVLRARYHTEACVHTRAAKEQRKLGLLDGTGDKESPAAQREREKKFFEF